jgi:hypothetical protein
MDEAVRDLSTETKSKIEKIYDEMKVKQQLVPR